MPECLHHPVFRYRTPRVIRVFVPRTAGFFEFAPVSASVSARQKGGFDLLSLHPKIPFLAAGLGEFDPHTGILFMGDLKARLANRVQPTTDGHKVCLKAVSEVDFDADYAMLNRIFATNYAGPGRYGPPKCIGAIKQVIQGDPDSALINTSFAERQNLLCE